MQGGAREAQMACCSVMVSSGGLTLSFEGVQGVMEPVSLKRHFGLLVIKHLPILVSFANLVYVCCFGYRLGYYIDP